MEDHVKVLASTETKEDAFWTAQAMVEKRPAAYAKVVEPMTSIYCWRGLVENTQESRCSVKGTGLTENLDS